MIGQIISHYRILEKLGGGGMGVVYRAEDTRLGRAVAIKFLPEKFASDRKALKRFQREAQTASTLNHPHICTIFDVGEYQGQPFIVMELLKGQTLQEHVGGKPLKTDELLEVAIQITDALDAAHSNGMVHRDMKPGNIFITESERVKILDFGLAKYTWPKVSDDEEISTELTAPGTLVGTVGYMSTEQALGKPLDHRSDLFSFGSVLYAMATGHRPFTGESPTEVVDAILHQDPDPLALYNRKVPPELQRIVDKLVAKNPDDRYQTAKGVLADLRRLKRSIDSPAASRVSASIPRFFKRLNKISWGLIIVTVLLVALWWMFSMTSTFSFEERDWILLGDFENFTEEPLLDDSLDLAFRVGLEQSRYANVFPESEVRKVLSRMKRNENEKIDLNLGIEVCQREGIRALVIGRIIEIGNDYSLSVEVVDPQTGAGVFTQATRANNRDRILGALEELIRRVRERLGESLSAIEETTRPLEKVTTANLEALKIYSLAMEKFERGQDEESIKFFERAIEIDPEFAMAHAKLGTAYVSLGTSSEKALEHWSKALQFSDRLTYFERLYVEGSAAWHGRPEQMIRIWSLMSTLYPDQAVGHHNLGLAHWVYENKFQEAAEAFAKGTGLRSRRFLSFHHLGYCQLALGLLEEALESFETASKMGKNPPSSGLADVYLASGLADAYMVVKRYQDAENLLKEATAFAAGQVPLEASLRSAALYVDQGKFGEAIDIYEKTSQYATNRGTRLELTDLLGLIASLENSAEHGTLRSALQQSIQAESQMLVDEPERVGPSPVVRLALLGKIWARNFDWQRAEKILSEIQPLVKARELPLWKAFARMLEGEIALAQKKNSKAMENLQEALSYMDLFQVHESLARAYEAYGDIDRAVEEYEWIVRHRGRAFAEGPDQLDPTRRDLNVVDWATAHFHLGRLHEKKGAKEKAVTYYQKFLDHWKKADENVPRLLEARRRLKQLQEARQNPRLNAFWLEDATRHEFPARFYIAVFRGT